MNIMKQKNITSKKQTCSLNEKDLVGNPIHCNREIFDHASGLCIFHCKEKPLEEFRDAFLKELERSNNDDSVEKYNCCFFIFPNEIDLSNLEFKKKTSFYEAKFGHNTDFSSATFRKEADFVHTKFGDDPSVPILVRQKK